MSSPSIPPAGKPPAKRSAFFLAELPYHELLRKRDPQKARKLEARMQQILGEAVYLFDGRVIDSIGPRMIAVMPDSAKALDAARKGQHDLIDHNEKQPPSGDVVEASLVVHSGDSVTDGSAFSSPTVSAGLQILRSMEPLQLLVSEQALREAGANVPRQHIGEVAGVRFFEPPPEPPKPLPPPPPVAPATAQQAPALRARKKTPLVLIGAIAGAMMFLVVIAIVLMKRSEKPDAPVATRRGAAGPAAVAAPAKTQIAVRAFNSAVTHRAIPRIEQLVLAVLRAQPGFEIVSPDGATEIGVAPAPEAPTLIVPTVGPNTGPAIPLEPPAAAAIQILEFLSESLGVRRNDLVPSSPAALEKFAQASASPSVASAEGAIQADPTFIPALRRGLEIFGTRGDRPRAIQAAERLLAVSPEENAVRSQLMKWLILEGRSADALPQIQLLVSANPPDPDALLATGRLALSVGDESRFRSAAARLQSAGKPVFHDPDLVLARGQIEPAIKAYYDLEQNDPKNSALVLKIGRIAVLRHSLEIAQLELQKLEELDPSYGAPLMQAYIAAERRQPQEAERYLQQAQLGAAWSDDVFTASAEVYAIMSQHSRVLESLKTAAARGEGLTYIISNPLFQYLAAESPDYVTLKTQLERQRSELRSKLNEISL